MADQLTHDHADLGKLLGEVRRSLKAGDIATGHTRLDLFWARLAMHIRAEHLHLFPALLRALSQTPPRSDTTAPSLAQAQQIIQELRNDHDFFMHELSRAIAALRPLLPSSEQRLAAATLAEVQGRLSVVADRLATHNAIEEGRVYLWTSTLLSMAEQITLADRIRNELENLPFRFVGGQTK